MSKRSNIRWQQADNEALRKAVKNFNAKITRIEKKNPEMSNVLPERVTMKQMRDLIETRQDLKRELNALRRFTQKGAEKVVTIPDSEYNIEITNWQKKEMTRRIAIINRKRKERLEAIEEIEMTSGGKPLGYTRKEFGMGKANKLSLTPMKAFTPRMTRTDLKKKFANIVKESQSSYWNRKDIQLIKNYRNTILENFNYEDIKDVLVAIDNMDFKEFYRIFEAEGKNFEVAYPPDSDQYEAYVVHLKSIFTPVK